MFFAPSSGSWSLGTRGDATLRGADCFVFKVKNWFITSTCKMVWMGFQPPPFGMPLGAMFQVKEIGNIFVFRTNKRCVGHFVGS